MSKPNSPILCAAAAPRRISGSMLTAALCVTLLQASTGAVAALTVTEEPAPSIERSGPTQSKTASGYRLRCWQHGRLLFEEDDIALPPDGSRYTLKLAGTDRDGRPLYVAETLNATCLVRHAPAVMVNPALPR
ncbi:MAG: hypothetical protein ABJB17_02665 [Burkholderiales bacterium]